MSKEQIVKRSGKVAFMMIEDTCHRMKGFTELSKSRNAKEYSRQYVDEESERTDVIGYSESVSFKMDYIKDNAVHEHIISIFDEEKLGADAVVSIVTVDFSQGTLAGGTYPAYKREYAVVPSTEGDSTDAYTYSGDFKANGKRTAGVATGSGEWLECTFAEDEEVSTSGDEGEQTS